MSHNDLSQGLMELVRQAELDIASGRYVVALGLLNEALRIQPDNGYIAALIARTEVVLRQFAEHGARETSEGRASGEGTLPGCATNVTTGRDFGSGLTGPKYMKGEQELDLDSRIRILTTIATSLYERGSVDAAMQSLFKARLLDPSSSLVRACEEALRPALDHMTGGNDRRPGFRLPETSGSETRENLSTYLEKCRLKETGAATGGQTSEIARAIGASLNEARIEALKRQKEMERRERELAMWREASRVYNDAGSPASPRPRQPQTPLKNKPGEQRSAFFSKIKQPKPSR